MCSRYYGHVAAKLDRREKRLSGLIFFLSSGAAVSFLANVDVWLPAVLALLVAGLSAWSWNSKYSQRSFYSSGLRKKFADLTAETKLLWGHLTQLEDDDIESQWQALDRRATEISEQAPSQVGLDRQLQEQSFDEAVNVLSGS